MSSWLSPIQKILDAETGDLRALAERVGGRPEIFYVGRDLSKCDLRGQDLRGMSFAGAILNPFLMDADTRIDPEYDPRFVPEGSYIQVGMREEVLALAYAFADASHYIYKAWALKALLDTGIRFLSNKEVHHVISANSKLKDLYYGNGKMRRVTILVYPLIQQAVHSFSISEGRSHDKDSYNQVFICGLVRNYITRNLAKDYVNVDPLDMFTGAARYLHDIRRGKRFIG